MWRKNTGRHTGKTDCCLLKIGKAWMAGYEPETFKKEKSSYIHDINSFKNR